MIQTQNIQKYLKEIEIMPFVEAFEFIGKYPNDVRLDVNILQAVFVKLFMQDIETQKLEKRYSECVIGDRLWKNYKNKCEIISYFDYKENFDELYNALKIVFKEGYLEFIEKLYDLRIVYIFVHLRKYDEINHLYDILKKHENSYNMICRNCIKSSCIKSPNEYFK